ncbi:hypothetical protein ACW9H6_13165 [Pseudomonas sp. SDO528_S397]
MKANWILALVGAAIVVGVVVAVGVLWAYGYYLGPVSRNATDWGSFGSVMSGAFTLLSSFATIGTLLFLYLQQLKGEERQIAQDADNLAKQQKHDVVVEKQLAALTFEQYLNHRKVFIERLNEQSVFFKGDIRFADPDRVYTAMFANNSPSHCEYKVKVDQANVKAYDLTDCLAIYGNISKYLENYQDKENNLILLQRMVHLQGCLGMTYVGPARNGDIYFFNFNSGINIYEFSKTLSRIERVLNNILFYTGNDKVTQIHHKGEGTLIRDAIYDTLMEYHRAKDAWVIKNEIEALPYLHKIYDVSQTFFRSTVDAARVLEETFVALSILFSDHQEIEKLNDFNYSDRLTDIILYEIKAAKELYKEDPTSLAVLDRIDSYHWAAMEHLGVTT